MRSWIQDDWGKAAGPDTGDNAIKKKISGIASEIANTVEGFWRSPAEISS